MNKDICKTHVKERRSKNYQSYKAFFGYKDFLRITRILTKLFEIQHSEKYGILFQLQRIGKVTKGMQNGKLYFSIYKNQVLLRGCKGVMLEVN